MESNSVVLSYLSSSLSLLPHSTTSRRTSSKTTAFLCNQTVLQYKWKNVWKPDSSRLDIQIHFTESNSIVRRKSCICARFADKDAKCSFLFKKRQSRIRSFSSRNQFAVNCKIIDFGRSLADFRKILYLHGKLEHFILFPFIRLAVGFMITMSLLATANKSPSWALTEENILFLEAWKTVDRAYVDKKFNGQNWFRYREKALKSEPMNTREETYAAIKKMLATLDDPFTRFLEPGKFKSLRSGTQGALTGVGLSIAYPMGTEASSPGLIVMSSTPEGPAYRAGIKSGDRILTIGGVSTDEMDIYDAAESLQGPEGSFVQLEVRSGAEEKSVNLMREKVTLNPVKSSLCEISVPGKEVARIGYIKLTTFNQNASGAVKNAIETLRLNNVTSFVLDLRNNSGGLFPEGIETAKIWLQKGVIVYICDSRGVRDIYEADGSADVAVSEPLAVLVNKGTASASEILAGALKDNNRAVLYGEPTFGKGKIQSVFELSDGSGLVITVARYETPAHNNIDKVGVIPNHPLPASFPLDEDGFCSCLRDPSSPCNLKSVKLFSR